MTPAPANLLAVRRLLLDTVESLDPAAVGSSATRPTGAATTAAPTGWSANDYSVVESPRDRAGLTLYASALDVGSSASDPAASPTTCGRSPRGVSPSARANTADTRDIREIIYCPGRQDGAALGPARQAQHRRHSHLWHTHFSFFRDATKAGRDQTPLFRRYLTTIGLLEGTDMTPEEHAWLETVHKNLTVLDGRNPVGQIYTRMAMGEDHTNPDLVGPASEPEVARRTVDLAADRADHPGRQGLHRRAGDRDRRPDRAHPGEDRRRHPAHHRQAGRGRTGQAPGRLTTDPVGTPAATPPAEGVPTVVRIAYLDNQLHGSIIERTADVHSLRRTWELVRAEALPHGATVELISEADLGEPRSARRQIAGAQLRAGRLAVVPGPRQAVLTPPLPPPGRRSRFPAGRLGRLPGRDGVTVSPGQTAVTASRPDGGVRSVRRDERALDAPQWCPW